MSAKSGVTKGALRPEIQALRAVAVLMVVVYHLWPDRLSGGFVGVDVFFVISGFLITAHLLREITATGTVAVSHFWARRIRRLLPAAFTVLVASLVATWLWLPKSVWLQTFQEIGASAVYGVNWLLALNSTDYLAAENESSIVQHFWSLSVEEQFYIVWPLLMLLAIAVTGRLLRVARFARQSRLLLQHKVLATVLAVVFVTSLVFSVVETARSQPSAYFITPTRAWEFAAGGLLAFMPTATLSRFTKPVSVAIRATASWLGLAAIGVAAVLFTASSAFPGYIALLPVLGAVAVMWAGNVEHAWAPTAVAKFGPIQWIGELSYSIYLWHWPLIVLYPYLRGNEPEFKGGLLILAASIVLAAATKRFVEDPVRTGQFWASRRRLAYSFAAAGTTVILAISSIGSLWLQQMSDDARVAPAFSDQRELSEAIAETLDSRFWPAIDQLPGVDAQVEEWTVDGCVNVTPQNAPDCVYGAQSERIAVILGDSHATAYLPAIRAALEPEGWQIHVLNRGQCPIADVAVHKWGESAAFVECDTHRAWAESEVQRLKPQLVLGAAAQISTIERLQSGNAGEDALAEWSAGLDEAYKRFGEWDFPVAIIGDVPRANCGDSQFLPSECRAASTLPGADLLRIERAAAARAGLVFIDSTGWFCSLEALICPTQVGSTLVRADGDHLTGNYSSRLGNVMRRALQDAGLVAY